ncbi:hypothetical protein [Pectobacterium parmentieri]|uniref:Uncharacterized protein n=1 Tax=Pectobacterium parmentieri TaxID=1905730 RepID=A0A8B3GB30_PECPM|nr:hypothetical protein [Pectobacterium parmentieri]AOR60793.1 hypothetical protein A8F97_18140 [Pectobacterium parmentieri]AYH12492.1 hypothetical protein C5E24_00225 [Pectobacterium parmentieri]AYH21207.1 hypothetical protein C5E22_00225 [Pectobacterium parmentieri]AYH38769.1 hypothetical protein C5E17_00225 [Pectobacterium parmentieri]AZS58996.1 hypothetical protein C5E18_00225 [Pectobacterium parmentieri]
MEHDKFMQYGRGLGLWRNPRENIKPEPINYFRDDPIYLTSSKGEWVNQIQECKKEINPLENGVFIWTEIKGTGHAFVSVHEGNNASVFTYGRFGRRSGVAGAVGDGILNFLRFEDARKYYREELYKMEAKAFVITDAEPAIARRYFETLWSSGDKVKETIKMGKSTKINGRTIDQYDVTGVNCTTHATKGVKIAGSKIFEGGYTISSQIRINYEEDFAVPVSLQRYLERKNAEPSMLVVDMTSEFRKQYPNTDNDTPISEDTTLRVVSEVVSGIGNISPYSGGTIDGLLDGMHDVNK